MIGEVGAGPWASDRAGGAVVGEGRLLRGVEGAEPVALLGGGVAYLGGVAAPWAASDAEVAAGGVLGGLLPGLLVGGRGRRGGGG